MHNTLLVKEKQPLKNIVQFLMANNPRLSKQTNNNSAKRPKSALGRVETIRIPKLILTQKQLEKMFTNKMSKSCMAKLS